MIYNFLFKIPKLTQDSENVALTHDKVFSTFDFKFCSGVFAIKNCIAYFQYHFFVFRTVTYCHNFTLQRFFFCCIRNNDTTNCFFFCRCRENKHSVC